MSMNKFIHHRNVYKQHPDFMNLRSGYPEFEKICTTDKDGKPVIDFQDENAVAVLTKCLLHKDFGLDIDFPADRLVPTLPLRLNYILWIEDILNSFELKDPSGIDIGCGASAIYPLLAAKKNQWRMTGLEVDQMSYKSAEQNVLKNGLKEKVKLILQSKDSGIFDQILEDDSTTFDFCMCNPPFYDESMTPQNRTGHRPLPKNATTGCKVELSCEGGEVAFIKKIISGSLKFRSRIKIYTTMIGIKADLPILIKELRKLGVSNYVDTEFCQGRTTRWGLAWTFDEDRLFLRTVPCIKSTFAREPAIFFIPEGEFLKMEEKGRIVEGHLMECLKEIDICPTTLEHNRIDEKRWRMKLTHVSWTNTRRRRREQLQGNSETDNASIPPTKKPRLENVKPILVADIYFNTVANGHTLQIFYLDGVQGKDACQQILQYVINKFNKIFSN